MMMLTPGELDDDFGCSAKKYSWHSSTRSATLGLSTQAQLARKTAGHIGDCWSHMWLMNLDLSLVARHGKHSAPRSWKPGHAEVLCSLAEHEVILFRPVIASQALPR